MPEKLLTIQEAARYLGLPEEEIKRLVDIGEIPAYKVGGAFLRFRREHIEAIKKEVETFEAETKEHAHVSLDSRGHPGHPYTDLEKEIKRREPIVRQFDYTFLERLRDFWYFKDFYLVSFLLVALIIYIISK